jgi:hypothetical protein
MVDPFGYVRQAVVNNHLSWLRRRPWRELPSGSAIELDLDFNRSVADPADGIERRLVLTAALGTLTRRGPRG